MTAEPETGKNNLCPLCNIPDSEVLEDFPGWKLSRTKTMKGHRERLMIYTKEHAKILDEQSVGEAYLLLLVNSRKFFSYTNKWGIFEPVYATVPDHWHRVASDLEPDTEDYDQILKTPRIIIDTRLMIIERVTPDLPEKASEAPCSADEHDIP